MLERAEGVHPDTLTACTTSSVGPERGAWRSPNSAIQKTKHWNSVATLPGIEFFRVCRRACSSQKTCHGPNRSPGYWAGTPRSPGQWSVQRSPDQAQVVLPSRVLQAASERPSRRRRHRHESTPTAISWHSCSALTRRKPPDDLRHQVLRHLLDQLRP